jgi:HPt (histidine-containing phosphotransfer) domain-containing protein
MDGDEVTGAAIRVKAVASLAVLVPRYLERRAEDVREMRRALAVGDLEPVRYIGHKMAGSGGGYGFDQLSTLGRRIEEAANGGDAASCSTCAEELETFLRRVEVVYED